MLSSVKHWQWCFKMVEHREKHLWYILTVSFALFGFYWAVVNNSSAGRYLYFGTKSRYFNISGAGSLAEVLKANVPENFEPIHVNVLTRHGSRNPTDSYFKKFEVLQKYLEDNDESGKTLALFQPFFDNLKGAIPGYLAYQGRLDLIGIGERVCSYWPNMCNVPFDKIYVDATYKERAYESAFWYVYGLLNLTDSSQFNFAFDGPQDATADSVKDGIEQLQQKLIFDINPPENDTVLRFYDACEKYVVSVDDNDTAMYQVTDFENTTTFQSSLQLLSDSFCAEGGLCSMNETILSNIYTACSHAQMMFNDYAPCEYIPQEVLETFEYCSDLKVYYKSYRGYNISYTSSCYLTRVITQDIQKAVKHDIIKRKKADEKECEQFEETAVNHDVTVKTGENEEIGDGSDQVFSHIVRAAHAETVLPVLGIMDAVYTEPLTADTYSIYRNFHSSRLAPMAANIIFTVYYSPERSQSRKPENSYFDNYFVTILLNERLLYLDGLNDPLRPNSPVPYKKFTQFLDTCSIEEFEKMCEETEEL